MDALINAAGRALAAGDILGALQRVALRDDPPALALRGIAMAQLGDLDRARELLRQAIKLFGPGEAVARARCAIAQAEIAFVSRDLSWPDVSVPGRILAAHGDPANAAHATHLAARRLLLLGRLDEASDLLASITTPLQRPALRAAHHLIAAGIAMRRLQVKEARAKLAEARAAAMQSGIAGLLAEVDATKASFEGQSARLTARGRSRLLSIDEVAVLLSAGEVIVVDACRNVIRCNGHVVPLATRPVLLALMRTLAEAWPEDVPRDVLLTRAFGARFVDESHRARLRVEIGRLRAALGQLGGIEATTSGFVLQPAVGSVAVLAPTDEDRYATILALLADGEAWASSALAAVLDTSARTVQRALEQLAAAGKVQSFGRGPSRRWITPPVLAFPTLLLLPGPLPGD